MHRLNVPPMAPLQLWPQGHKQVFIMHSYFSGDNKPHFNGSLIFLPLPTGSINFILKLNLKPR